MFAVCKIYDNPDKCIVKKSWIIKKPQHGPVAKGHQVISFLSENLDAKIGKIPESRKAENYVRGVDGFYKMIVLKTFGESVVFMCVNKKLTNFCLVGILIKYFILEKVEEALNCLSSKTRISIPSGKATLDVSSTIQSLVSGLVLFL